MLRHEKICERIEVLSMVVGLGLTIFHSKTNWRIFNKTDSWIFCLIFTRIDTNNINYHEPLHVLFFRTEKNITYRTEKNGVPNPVKMRQLLSSNISVYLQLSHVIENSTVERVKYSSTRIWNVF